MPVSEYTLAGMKANGHRWQHETPRDFLKEEVSKLAEFNNRINEDGPDYDQVIVAQEESEPVVKALRTKVAHWAQGSTTLSEEARQAIIWALDEVEMIEDCNMDEINYALNRLWDEFDYWRVLIR